MLFAISNVLHAESILSDQRVRQPIDKTFRNVLFSLDNAGFRVVKKINVSKKLAKAAKEQHWKDYNKNHLAGIYTAIVCSGKGSNALSNEAPTMVAIFPVHVTLVQQGEWTHVEFVKPAVIARGTAAEKFALKLQKRLTDAIHDGLLPQ